MTTVSELCRAWTVLHADAELVVVDKPAGLLSVPGRGEGVHHNLAVQVQRDWPDALVVHRLDQATSGLMLFARGAAMQRALSMAFERRLVSKRYEAVVQGLVRGDEGVIDAPLRLDWPRRPRQVVDAIHGKPSLTRWRVLERDDATATTRLMLQPVTGRSHQLRVHLAHLGHPIVGDVLYGVGPAAGPPAARMLLHAAEIGFEHPLSGGRRRFASPVPF